MLQIDIIVGDAGWPEELPGSLEQVHRAAKAALRHVFGPPGSKEVELAVMLADDATVQDLNRRFRNKDAPTNVLAFPASEPPPESGPIGDVVLARETCCREAAAQGKPIADHLAHLVVHGVLHLAGRDHLEDRRAAHMEAEERLILDGLGIPDPYETDAASAEPGGAGQ